MPPTFGKGEEPYPFEAIDPVLMPHFAKPTSKGGKKYAIVTQKGWYYLPPLLQEMVKQFLTSQTLDNTKHMIASHKLGIAEEACDVLYEAASLAAIQEGLIRPGLLKSLERSFIQAHYSPLQSQSRGLQYFMATSLPKISQKDAQHFARFLNIPSTNINDARDLLALTYLRLSSLQAEGRFKHLEVACRSQMMDELAELLENLPDARQKQQLSQTLSPLLSARKLSNSLPQIQHLLIKALTQALGHPISPQQAIDFPRAKHIIRQGLRLATMNDTRVQYDVRKAISKPFEAIVEAMMFHPNPSPYRLPSSWLKDSNAV